MQERAPSTRRPFVFVERSLLRLILNRPEEAAKQAQLWIGLMSGPARGIRSVALMWHEISNRSAMLARIGYRSAWAMAAQIARSSQAVRHSRRPVGTALVAILAIRAARDGLNEALHHP